jgi:FkbM family methyltransferase
MRKGIVRDYLLPDYPPNSFDYFIDIGGCSGYFSEGVLEVNEGASVVIYEPFVKAYEWMRQKFEGRHNVRIENCALGDGSDLSLACEVEDWSDGVFVKEETGLQKAPSKTFSEIVDNSGVILTSRCGLKIDAEGAEWQLLDDPRAIPLLRQFMYIAIEIHFPAKGGRNPQFASLPIWRIFDAWLRDNLSDTHEIKYHRNDRPHGHGIYILTKTPFEPPKMNFKNCIVGNFSGGKRYKLNNLTTLINAQIENSLELGWRPEDIILISNFDYEFMGVRSLNVPLNQQCLTGSKMFGMKHLFDQGLIQEWDGVVWAHDLDAWQNMPFGIPSFKDVGIVCYSNAKFNGGSIFWSARAGDIVQEVIRIITSDQQQKEEPTLNAVLKSPQFSDRITVLNNTYNVGCSGYVVRYDKSIKPLRVCHFHPYNRLAWETHALDRNGLDTKGISDRLERVIRKYYPDLPTELPLEGRKTQAQRRERRLQGLPVKPKGKKN